MARTKKQGRPAKEESERLSTIVAATFRPVDAARAKEVAEASGTTLAQWLRELVLDAIGKADMANDTKTV